MDTMIKDNLCVKCALLKSTDKNGYIACPNFTRKRQKNVA